METKFLKLEGSKGKEECEYVLELEIPDKSEVIELLELPPHDILSKDEITFSTGILAQASHAAKLLISRDYQDLYVGLFVKIDKKPDSLIEIQEVKGSFEPLPPKGSGSNLSRTSSGSSAGSGSDRRLSRNLTLPAEQEDSASDNSNPEADAEYRRNANVRTARISPRGAERDENLLDANANVYDIRAPYVIQPYVVRGPNNNPSYQPFLAPTYTARQAVRHLASQTVARMQSQNEGASSSSSSVTFSMQKQSSSEMKIEELKDFVYFRSFTQHNWPRKRSLLRLTLRAVRIKFSNIVEDETLLAEGNGKGSSLFNAEKFFLSDYCSDVKLKVGKEIFPGHKIVLSARSEYFLGMFSNPMKESKEGVVVLKEDVRSFRELLRFIYTGMIEGLEELVGDLFLLADKYQIEELSQHCEEYLLGQLCVENVIEMYDLSHSVGKQGKLAKKAKEIILWNKEKLAPDLDTFKEFFNKYPELIFEILKL